MSRGARASSSRYGIVLRTLVPFFFFYESAFSFSLFRSSQLLPFFDLPCATHSLRSFNFHPIVHTDELIRLFAIPGLLLGFHAW